MFKVFLLGTGNSGKYDLRDALVGKSLFDYKSTIGVDFQVKTIKYNGEDVKLQIWDMAGTEIFKVPLASSFKNANCILLCYSIFDNHTFEHIKKRLEFVNNLNNLPNNAAIFLVGIEDNFGRTRAVKKAKAEDLANANGLQYFEINLIDEDSEKHAHEIMIKAIEKTRNTNSSLYQICADFFDNVKVWYNSL